MTYKDAILDRVEEAALLKLHQEGYLQVKKSHIAFFKDIYEFISRFANEEYHSDRDRVVRLRMTTGEVPKETARIVEKIGARNLWKYFSPMEYEKRFYDFCMKLVKTKRINSADYLAGGAIIAEEIEVEGRDYVG